MIFLTLYSNFIPRYKSLYQGLAILMLSLALSGCFAKSAKEKLPAETLFSSAVTAMEKGKYDEAISEFEELEIEYSSSQYVEDSLIFKAVSYYRNKQYDLSVDTIDQYLKQFPRHERADYMLYMRGLNYYEQVVDISRDQQISILAKMNFEKLISIYPESKYSLKAKLKVDYLNALLAGKEMDIGYYYYKHNKYMAAVNRFSNVINDYDTTIFVPEALYRISEIFLQLRMFEEAKKYAIILGTNYPNSKWYHKIYDTMSKKNLL